MNNRHRQNGVTGTGWLVILALIGFFSLLVLKLGPIYLEHFSVVTVLKSLEEEPLITKKSVAEIRKLVQKRLKVNGVYDMKRDAIKIKRSSGVTTVDISYDVRTNMAGNVDAIVTFSDQVELVSN